VDGIPPSLLTGGGVLGLLSFTYVAFMRGWIHVGSMVDKLIADKDQQIVWLREANESLTESVRKYAVSAETSAHALHEIEKRAASKGGDD
jgi:hypothetical protein